MSTPGSVDILLKTTTTNAVLGPLMSNAFITKASVVSLTNAAITVTVYRVPSGITVTTTNHAIINKQSVPNGVAYVLPLAGQALPNGFALYAKCSATNAVNFNASYVIP